MTNDLRERRCEPCHAGTPKLGPEEIAKLALHLPVWSTAGDRLKRTFVFHDFAGAMQFVNKMAAVAEAEQHHPDFSVHYRDVTVTIWTHAVGGLSENDFILAAKIDAL